MDSKGTCRVSLLALLLALVAADARGQTTTQVWPEVSSFVKLTSQTRLFFLATTVKEDRDSTSGEFGPNFDIYLSPIRHKRHWAEFLLDESKNRLLLLRFGYRYMPTYSSDDPVENRGVFEGTVRYPLVRGLLASSRNRFDFRFIDGDYSWRYRNRLSLEREFSLGAVRVNPYGRAEFFYDSRFSKWSRTELTAGLAVPITRHWELEGYFDNQHDTGGSPNRTVHAFGAVVNIYLR